MRREPPPFEQAGRGAVRLEVRAVDDEAIRLARLASEACEDPVENAHAAPSDEAVVECLVRPIAGRRVTPAKPGLDDEDDPADDATVVHARDAV
jgi:hypothetical protein